MRISHRNEVNIARMHLEGIDRSARADNGHAASALGDVSHLCGLRMPMKLTHALMGEIDREHGDVFEDGPEVGFRKMSRASRGTDRWHILFQREFVGTGLPLLKLERR